METLRYEYWIEQSLFIHRIFLMQWEKKGGLRYILWLRCD